MSMSFLVALLPAGSLLFCQDQDTILTLSHNDSVTVIYNVLIKGFHKVLIKGFHKQHSFFSGILLEQQNKPFLALQELLNVNC